MSFNSITDFPLHNSFIGPRLSRYYARTRLSAGNCRVITPELLYHSPIVALLRQNSFIPHRLSRCYAKTRLSADNCRVVTPKLVYRPTIVALLRQNSFIAHRLSRCYARSRLSLTDCRVIAPELLYCSPIVALPNLTLTLLVKLSNAIKLAGAVNLKKKFLIVDY